MSDPKPPYGEPIEEPTAVDDVVGRANEGLADADAAGRDAVGDAAVEQPEPAAAADAVSPDPVPSDAAAAPASADAASTDAASSDDVPWYERDDIPFDDDPPAPAAAAAETVAEPVITPSEPASVPAAEQPTELIPPAAVAPVPPVAGPQPIFVQAPEPPRPRGNRAAAGAIGLLAAVAFAVLYLAAGLGVGLIDGSITGDGLGAAAADALTTWSLWVPTAVFFLSFWLLGAIINRGRWGYWVVFGLLVGVASYGGHIVGQLFQAPFWNLTAREGGELTEGQLLVPLAIAALVIGRELTIWFGAWVAARGKRVSELNYEAQREYERTIEAGPAIVRQAQG